MTDADLERELSALGYSEIGIHRTPSGGLGFSGYRHGSAISQTISRDDSAALLKWVKGSRGG